jgi:predicted phosphohydrolase
MAYTIQSWEDFWQLYRSLIQLSLENKQETIADKLKEAQRYVNGLTDGWHDFKNEFEKVISSNRKMLTREQLELANYLLTTLHESLTNR